MDVIIGCPWSFCTSQQRTRAHLCWCRLAEEFVTDRSTCLRNDLSLLQYWDPFVVCGSPCLSLDRASFCWSVRTARCYRVLICSRIDVSTIDPSTSHLFVRYTVHCVSYTGSHRSNFSTRSRRIQGFFARCSSLSGWIFLSPKIYLCRFCIRSLCFSASAFFVVSQYITPDQMVTQRTGSSKGNRRWFLENFSKVLIGL